MLGVLNQDHDHDHDPDQVIGASAAARLLGISRNHLGRLSDAGRVQAQLTPYGRAFRLGDVERLRRERETKQLAA